MSFLTAREIDTTVFVARCANLQSILTQVEGQVGDIDQGDPHSFLFIESHVGLSPRDHAVADQQRLLRGDRQIRLEVESSAERYGISAVVIGLVGRHVDVAQFGLQGQGERVEQEVTVNFYGLVPVCFQRKAERNLVLGIK